MIEEERNADGMSEEELWEQLEGAVGTTRIDILMDLSEFAVRRGKDADALTLAEQAVAEARKEGDAKWLGRSLEILGRRFYKVDRFAEAAQAHMEAGAHYAEFDSGRDAAFSYLHASWSFELIGEAEQELQAVNLALSFAETLDQVPGTFFEQRATALQDLGAETGEILQALSDARQSYRSIEDANSVLRIDDRVANMMLDEGDTKSAVTLLSDCLDVAESLDEERLGYFAFRHGLALNMQRDFEPALEALNRSLEIFLRQDTVKKLGSVYLEIAFSHDGMHNRELALRTAAKARAHFDMGGDDDGVRNADRFRAVVLHGMGRYDEAAAINLAIAESASGIEAFAARARRADNLRAAGELSYALQAAQPVEGDEEFAGSPMWFWREAVRAQIFEALGTAERAWEIAVVRLQQDMTGASAWVQAVFHEMRGDSHASDGNEEAAAADWARAVAFYLASGNRDAATRLSEQFLPETDQDGHQ